jgi:hypothetical protein
VELYVFSLLVLHGLLKGEIFTEEDDGPCDSLAYSSANVIKEIKSGRTMLIGHVACTRCRILANSQLKTRRDERRWKICVADAMIILKRIVGSLPHSHKPPSPVHIPSQYNIRVVHVPIPFVNIHF